MQKKAITVDPTVVGRYALGGALTGGAIASTLNLAHMIRQMREDLKKRTAKTETDENTIVLTLPRKHAEQVEQNSQVSKIKTLVSSNARDLIIKGGPQGQQSREKVSGKFGHQLCKAGSGATGWPTLTASALAALVGGTTGAALVNKMYEVQREKRLQAELDAAKQEYMDLLGGKQVKGAEIIEEMFPYLGDFEKQADSAFGLLNYPLAAAALLTILGSGGAAYLTKKILDEKLRETDEKSLDIPKIKRIVLQSAPTTGFKQASENEREAVAAGLMVMLDVVGHQDLYLGDPAVKAAMVEAKLTREAVTGTGSEGNWDTILGVLEGNPHLRKALYGLYTDFAVKGSVPRAMQHAALAIPGVSHLADRKLYSTLARARYNVPPGGAASVKMVPGTKQAQDVASMGTSMLGTLLGKKMVGGGTSINQDELVKAVMAAQETAKEETRARGMKVRDKVRIEARDPEAAQYLEQHKNQVAGLVKRLAQEGQL